MIRTMKRLASTASALAVALGLAACGPEYDHTDITTTQQGLGGEASSQRIIVTEGSIVTAHIVPWNDDKDPLSLTIREKYSGITAETYVLVKPTVNDRVYAFIGLKAGTSELEFVADGTVVLTIPVLVKPQS